MEMLMKRTVVTEIEVEVTIEEYFLYRSGRKKIDDELLNKSEIVETTVDSIDNIRTDEAGDKELTDFFYR